MISSTVKDRVERRVFKISEMVGKSAFSSIFGEKTELKNDLKRVALLLVYCWPTARPTSQHWFNCRQVFGVT